MTWREFYFQGGGVTRLWMSLLFAFILVGVVAGITGVIGAPMGVEAIGGLCITIGFILASIKWALELGTVFKPHAQTAGDDAHGADEGGRVWLERGSRGGECQARRG